MLESPRIRRLRSDYRSLEKLRAESSILDFMPDPGTPNAPPEVYSVRFWGKGLWRPPGSTDVLVAGASRSRYPPGRLVPAE